MRSLDDPTASPADARSRRSPRSRARSPAGPAATIRARSSAGPRSPSRAPISRCCGCPTACGSRGGHGAGPLPSGLQTLPHGPGVPQSLLDADGLPLAPHRAVRRRAARRRVARAGRPAAARDRRGAARARRPRVGRERASAPARASGLGVASFGCRGASRASRQAGGSPVARSASAVRRAADCGCGEGSCQHRPCSLRMLYGDLVKLSKIIRLPCPRRWETSRINGTSADVLVIGSGGAGLQAALAAARSGARVLLATKLGLASSNTAKAQGGIQAALGDGRRPVGPRRRRLQELARHRRPVARRGADRRGARRDRAARAVRRRVHALARRRLPARPLRRRDAQAAPAGGRPHRARDRDGAARGRCRGRAHRRRSTTRRLRRSSGRERVPRDAPSQGGRRAASWRCSPARSCSRPAAAASPRRVASGPSRRTPREPRAR